MEPKQVVRGMWERMQERDWDGMAALLAPDLVVDWPANGERIVGRDDFVAFNATYPEGWSIRILRLLAEGDQVVAEVEVPHETLGAFRVASISTVSGDVITHSTEYWKQVGEDPPSTSPYVRRS